MSPEERIFLRNFFQQLMDQPLSPRDERYIPLYDDPELVSDDPVELLARAIEWTPGESVQLLSGFRGTGKSTELRRLQQRLESAGYIVFLCDIEDYLNLSTPVDVSDFLMAVAGALSDAVIKQKLLDSPQYEGYWTRFASFLTRTKIEFTELSGNLDTGAGLSTTIKANLKSDPTFKQLLQKRMAGHLGTLVADVRKFFEESIKALKARHGSDLEVVLLLDSVEHIRGPSINAQEVQSSVETLFASHADKLHLPYLHVVYTVPPYLKVRYSNLGSLYEPGGVQVLPAFKLHQEDGTRLPKSYDAIQRVVRARGDWRRLLGERSSLDRLIKYSGGHACVTYCVLLAEILRRAKSLPVPESTVDAAIDQLRTEFLPIADDDALWLAEIARSHQTALENTDHLPDLARFFDTHLALCYRNGHEWYDVHPLVLEHALAQAQEARKRRKQADETS